MVRRSRCYNYFGWRGSERISTFITPIRNDWDPHGQHTPDQANWDPFATKPFESGANTAHDTGWYWLDRPR